MLIWIHDIHAFSRNAIDSIAFFLSVNFAFLYEFLREHIDISEEIKMDTWRSKALELSEVECAMFHSSMKLLYYMQLASRGLSSNSGLIILTYLALPNEWLCDSADNNAIYLASYFRGYRELDVMHSIEIFISSFIK